jgi:hypothetical protein
MRNLLSPNRRRNAAKSATAKIAHIAITPKGENGVGDNEGKRVEHVRRTCDPETADVDDHRRDQHAAGPVMCAPRAISRKSRQISRDQQRLDEQETKRENSGKSRQDVERAAPLEQIARRCEGDRHANGGHKGSPDQGRPDRRHPAVPDQSAMTSRRVVIPLSLCVRA